MANCFICGDQQIKEEEISKGDLSFCSQCASQMVGKITVKCHGCGRYRFMSYARGRKEGLEMLFNSGIFDKQAPVILVAACPDCGVDLFAMAEETIRLRKREAAAWLH